MPENNETVWTTIAHYCSELAPVVGPLLSAASDTAEAIERASSGDQHASHAVFPVTTRPTYKGAIEESH